MSHPFRRFALIKPEQRRIGKENERKRAKPKNKFYVCSPVAHAETTKTRCPPSQVNKFEPSFIVAPMSFHLLCKKSKKEKNYKLKFYEKPVHLLFSNEVREPEPKQNGEPYKYKELYISFRSLVDTYLVCVCTGNLFTSNLAAGVLVFGGYR